MILGIDLGTSNSMAAVYRNGQVEFITSRTGNKLIPSVVSMDEEGYFYAGDVAKERKLRHPEMTVDLFKRSMGTKQMFGISGKELTACELSAVVLKSIKEDAENYLKEAVSDVIISVPAFFNNAQRKAVLKAGKLAGFNVKKIINEPTAAALAYGVSGTTQGKFEEKIILVLDLGGGTFDISVMEVSDTVMEVVAVCGDNRLGGSDFTKRLEELFLKHNRIAVTLNRDEEAWLWNQAEKAKKQISIKGTGRMECSIRGRQYEYTITEAEYEEVCFDLLEKIRRLTIKAVEESKYKAEEIEDIIMVGGGTKLSIVKKMIEKLAGKALDYPISPDEAVVMGAALQGAMLERKEDIKELVMTDIAPYYIGTMTIGGSGHDLHSVYDVILQKNVTIPSKGTVVHRMGASSFRMSAYQMEDKYGEKCYELGGLNYIVPELGNGNYVDVHKSVYYDNNGIIHLSVYIPATGVKFENTLEDENNEMLWDETTKRLEELDYLNLGDGSLDADKLLIAQADNLYMEMDIEARQKLSRAIVEFEGALKSGKRSDAMKHRHTLETLVNIYQTTVF